MPSAVLSLSFVDSEVTLQPGDPGGEPNFLFFFAGFLSCFSFLLFSLASFFLFLFACFSSFLSIKVSFFTTSFLTTLLSSFSSWNLIGVALVAIGTGSSASAWQISEQSNAFLDRNLGFLHFLHLIAPSSSSCSSTSITSRSTHLPQNPSCRYLKLLFKHLLHLPTFSSFIFSEVSSAVITMSSTSSAISSSTLSSFSFTSSEPISGVTPLPSTTPSASLAALDRELVETRASAELRKRRRSSRIVPLSGGLSSNAMCWISEGVPIPYNPRSKVVVDVSGHQ